MDESVITVDYRVNPEVSNDAINALLDASWPEHSRSDFAALHRHSLAYLCAFAKHTLIGYVNLAWDGNAHAFLLDTTVHPEWQRRGVGRQLAQLAAETARRRGVEWLHVDYEPHLAGFYLTCGFHPTAAGLIRLTATGQPQPETEIVTTAAPTLQLPMIERLRDACRRDPRVVAATLYGSFVTGEADAYSDIEAALYFDPASLPTLDRQAWVAQVAPVLLFFADDFGHYTAIFENLVRGEFHFDPADRMAEIENWRGNAWFPSVSAAVLVDRTGELTQQMEALDHAPPERDTSEAARLLVMNFINGVLFGAQVLARGEAARALEILTCGVLRHLERMARLVEGSTAHWPTPSRGWEHDLSPETQARLRDCTARLDSAELARAYRRAWAWGRTLAAALIQRHGFDLPDTLLDTLSQRTDDLLEDLTWQ